ncbi:hypothetical protein Emag_000010 [Eimeria magna]
MAAVNAEQLSVEGAATALKGTIVLTAECSSDTTALVGLYAGSSCIPRVFNLLNRCSQGGKAIIEAAAREVADALSKAELEAAAQTSSWAEEYGPRLLDLHDDVIMFQNNALTFVFASESQVLLSSTLDTKSLILDQIRSRSNQSQ